MPKLSQTPKEHNRQIQMSQDDDAAKRAQRAAAFKSLVLHPGWKYLKEAGMAYVIRPYEADPPKTDEDRTKFETFNTLVWGFNRLIAIVEQAAKD